jgi:DNA replication protein DnaC
MVMVSSMRRELVFDDMLRMRIPRRYWDITANQVSRDGDPSAHDVLVKYLAKMTQMVTDGVGLLFWGDNGRGKTCAAVLIAKEARRCGFSVLFVESASLKQSVINNERFDDVSVWDRARDVEVLVLDDLGKGVQDTTGFGARLLDELLRHRCANKLVTIITTNMNPQDQLAEELKVSTIAVLKESVLPVKVVGRDFRDEAKSKVFDVVMGR